MSLPPTLSVCIPAYNRAEFLMPLLDSILCQSFTDFEIVISEDCSPQREEILRIVEDLPAADRDRIRFHENESNLGYDGNIRQLIELASGDYCVFMGNDDLMCEGALAEIADVIGRVPECGVVVRSYATFDADPERQKQVFRYFEKEHRIEAGREAVTAGYRRSVVIPGMTLHRRSALEVATSRFDGTLLYQLYLVGMILAGRAVVFTPKVIALRRDGIDPDFGNSDAERGRFVPKDQTPESSVYFVKGMLDIAAHVEERTGLDVFDPIRKDIGAYSYPILAIQAKRPLTVFVRYVAALARLGFWRYPLFYAYFLLLLVLGPDRTERMIVRIKQRLGYTPRIGVARQS